MAAKKYSYFDFLLDKSGGTMKIYLEAENKDPSPWELCKQLIEKSLAIANAASLSQGATESELKVYEAQRIWQPLCLAMTMLSHLEWDLDVLQQKVPLHLQQILMEELLKGYGISQVPKPEDFDINKFNKRASMVHILYNRWVVRTITKYEEFKERDQLPNNLSTVQRELKENQEMQIFLKVKEFRTLSVDILEKSINLNSDIEIPLPRPRFVTANEIMPTQYTSLKTEENSSGQLDIKMEEETQNTNERQGGVTMKVPDILNISVPVKKDEILIKICYDLGCYYFPKELYSDASRVFQKAIDIIKESDNKELMALIDYKKLSGYHNACRLMEKESFSNSTEISDLCFRLEQSTQNEYKDIFTVLKEDNLERNIPYTQRLNIEKELFLMDKKDDLFTVCSLNFIRSCLDNRALPSAFCQSLGRASKKELRSFAKHCKNCLESLKADVLIKRLKDAVRLVLQMLPPAERNYLTKDGNLRPFIEKTNIQSAKLRKTHRDASMEEESDGCIDDDDEEIDVARPTFIDSSQEERIRSIVKLRAKLSSCFDPESIKDILFEIHQISPEKSHAINKQLLIKKISFTIQRIVPFVKINSPRKIRLPIRENKYPRNELFWDQKLAPLKAFVFKVTVHKGYEFPIYQDIIQEIQDLLMYDTVHVFITKAKQLTTKNKFTESLSLLNICVETLKSYATRASPSCSVGRVKNILHHELLWTELNFAEVDPENANLQETMRRSKACIKHSQQQDPPPYQHIYQAIIIHLLNEKEFQFLCDAGVDHDVNVVDCLQLGFHLSSVVCGLQRGVEVLRSAAKGLWETILRIVADKSDGSLQLQGPAVQNQPSSTARGPLEDKHMRDLQCFIRKEELVDIITKLKDDTLLSLLLSCTTSLLASNLKDSVIEMKDSYTHLWPSTCESAVSTTSVEIMSVLTPFCKYCLHKNSRNISWLRTIGDVFLVEGNYNQAMRCYLELGSITTSFFSRPAPYSVWDEKIYRNMILCCQKENAYTLVTILSQFLDPVDYTTAFKAIQEKASDDGMEVFYDCIWDVNILEYLIYSHDKRGEIEKRKLTIKTMSKPELNCRSSPEILQQTRDICKTKFLRTLTRMYWN